MIIHPARPDDKSLVVGVCTRALFDDDLFGRAIGPLRDAYLEDIPIYWHESLRRCWASPRIRILVAVADLSHGQGQETIIGVAA